VTFSRRGVATGWTGVDMSTPFLPEVVHEIDANPVTFYSGGGGLGALTLDSAGAPPPDAHYMLTLRALAMRVHPTFFDLATPLFSRVLNVRNVSLIFIRVFLSGDRTRRA